MSTTDAGVVIPMDVAAKLAPLRGLMEADSRRRGYLLDREVIAAFDQFDYARKGADVAHRFRRSSAPPPSGWVDTMTAATALGITDRAVRKRCIEKRINAAKDRAGTWRIDPQELNR
jgi:hypothetical protein